MHGFDGKGEQSGSLGSYDPDTDSWTTLQYNPDGKSGPIPSSVSSLLSLTVNGRASIVILFGKLDPSTLGHWGAGKMSDYIWRYDIDDKKWSQVRLGAGDKLAPRGWFAADTFGESRVVVHDGIDEDNNRLGDIWIVDLSARSGQMLSVHTHSCNNRLFRRLASCIPSTAQVLLFHT